MLMVIAPTFIKVYEKLVHILIDGGEVIAMISAFLFHMNTKNKPLQRFVNMTPLYICISINVKTNY